MQNAEKARGQENTWSITVRKPAFKFSLVMPLPQIARKHEESFPLAKMVQGEVLTLSVPKARKILAQEKKKKKKPSLPYLYKDHGLEQKWDMVFELGSTPFSQVVAPQQTSFLLHKHLSHMFGFCCGKQLNLSFGHTASDW